MGRTAVTSHLRYACAGLALSGCAVGPDYRPPEPAVPPHWTTTDGAGAPGDLSEWWRRIDDPLLSDLVEEALLDSPDLRGARARLREARARRAAAAGELLPSVTGSATARRGRESGGGDRDSFSAGFDASWELDLFGGVRQSVEAAEADEASAEADLHDARVSLVAEAARAYVEVRGLQVRLGIARDNAASQLETLELTGWRAGAGLVSAQDVDQARSNREQTLAQIPSLQVSLAEAEHRLDILLGKPPGTLDATLEKAGQLPDVPAGVAVGIPADTLRQRPDVRAAERRLAAATARVGVAEAARYPTFRLSGSIGLEALTLGALGSPSAVYSLLGGITAPIFDAGRLRDQAEAQDAVREQAEVAYEQTVLAALQEVEDALVAFARTRERAEALARAATAAGSAAKLARQRYSAGLIDFQSVLDTERSLLALEDSLATTRTNNVLALIRLYKALGGGWSPAGSGSAMEAP